MGMLVGIIIVGLIIYGVVSGVKTANQHRMENETFTGKYRGWEIYISPHSRGVIALNHELKRLVVGTATSYRERSWSDLSSVEIQKNGQTLTQTNRGSQTMGAAVGAVLLGPVGLLLGGLSGSKRNSERVEELTLKVVVDDAKSPVHRVVFFKMAGNGVDANSSMLKEPAKRLEHFHALLSNAIRTEQRDFSQQTRLSAGYETSDIRLARLWELHQAGALTALEYSDQKQVILAQATSIVSH